MPSQDQVTTAAPDAAAPGRPRRPWLAIAAVALVTVGVWAALAVTVFGGDEPDPSAPVASPLDAVPDEQATSGVDPLLEGGLEVGDTARLLDGARARVRSVTSGVEPVAGSPPADADTVLHRADVELCAGQAELFVDGALWLGHGADAQVHSAHMGVRDLVTLTLAPGSCQRGTVDLAVPADVELDAVLLADLDRSTAARWELPGVPTGDDVEPLRSDTRPEALALDEPAVPLTGGRAQVHDLSWRGADDLPAGATSLELDVERCAGPEAVPTGPRSWLVQLADHRFVAAERQSATLAEGELDAGSCERGTVAFVVPADTEVRTVTYTYGGSFEEARWTVDGAGD